LWPEEAGDKVKLLRAFHDQDPASEAGEIPDPIGAALPFYRYVAQILKASCDGVLDAIK
jgi:hypothetical protein